MTWDIASVVPLEEGSDAFFSHHNIIILASKSNGMPKELYPELTTYLPKSVTFNVSSDLGKDVYFGGSMGNIFTPTDIYVTHHKLKVNVTVFLMLHFSIYLISKRIDIVFPIDYTNHGDRSAFTTQNIEFINFYSAFLIYSNS